MRDAIVYASVCVTFKRASVTIVRSSAAPTEKCDHIEDSFFGLTIMLLRNCTSFEGMLMAGLVASAGTQPPARMHKTRGYYTACDLCKASGMQGMLMAGFVARAGPQPPACMHTNTCVHRRV